MPHREFFGTSFSRVLGIDRTPVVVAAPTDEPLTRAFVKVFTRYDDDCDDEIVDFQITAARQHYERRTRRQLMRATFDYFIDDFPIGQRPIEIPKPPLVSITEIFYVDEDEVTQQLATSVFDVNIAREPGRVFLKVDEDWPDLGETKENAVRIRFVAGAALSTDVPSDDRQAVLLLAAHWIENREPVVIGDRDEPFPVPLSYSTIENRRVIPEIR